MINEFKYGQPWKILPSLLSLSLYSNSKCKFIMKKGSLKCWLAFACVCGGHKVIFGYNFVATLKASHALVQFMTVLCLVYYQGFLNVFAEES